MLSDLDSAINYGFKTKEAFLRRAEVKCDDLDKCKEAVLDYDAALSLTPDDLMIYVSRAHAKGRTDDLSGAIADLREVVNRYNIKKYNLTNNQNPSAALANNATLNINTVVMALLNLGGLVMHKENKEMALDAYNQAIALAPNDSSCYEFRGHYKIMFGELDDAISDLDKAIELSNQNALAYIYRGIALLSKNNTIEAQKDLDKGLELAPHLKDLIQSIIENAEKSRLKNQPAH